MPSALGARAGFPLVLSHLPWCSGHPILGWWEPFSWLLGPRTVPAGLDVRVLPDGLCLVTFIQVLLQSWNQPFLQSPCLHGDGCGPALGCSERSLLLSCLCLRLPSEQNKEIRVLKNKQVMVYSGISSSS